MSDPCPRCGVDRMLLVKLDAEVERLREREQQAIGILTLAVDDIDGNDLLELCRRLELDCNAEHERAMAAEAEVERLREERGGDRLLLTTLARTLQRPGEPDLIDGDLMVERCTELMESGAYECHCECGIAEEHE